MKKLHVLQYAGWLKTEEHRAKYIDLITNSPKSISLNILDGSRDDLAGCANATLELYYDLRNPSLDENTVQTTDKIHELTSFIKECFEMQRGDNLDIKGPDYYFSTLLYVDKNDDKLIEACLCNKVLFKNITTALDNSDNIILHCDAAIVYGNGVDSFANRF